MLEAALRAIPGVRVLHPRQANAVFAGPAPPGPPTRSARAGWRFYDFIGGGSRFMCAWDSTEDDVRALADDLATVAATR